MAHQNGSIGVLRAPAYLISGSSSQTRAYAHDLIKKFLCNEQGCNTCISCKGVEAHQHHRLLWICPEKNYTRELIEPVFHTISFARNHDDLFFIVLEDAGCLTPSVASSLLKSLEEPPSGYIFLLLTRTSEQVMPTIASRCVVHQLEEAPQDAVHASLIALLKNPHITAYAQFQKELAAMTGSERALSQSIDGLYEYWYQELKAALREANERKAQRATMICTILQTSMKHPPMPGSAKLFLRNLFMQLVQAHAE